MEVQKGLCIIATVMKNTQRTHVNAEATLHSGDTRTELNLFT